MQSGREIKFRAWNGKELISAVYPKSNYKFEVDWDGKFKLHTFNERQEITDEYGESWKQPIWSTVEDAVIMQFTGLRDKNGKEIYEGDILRYPDAYDSGSDWEETLSVGAIEWDASQAQFTVTNRHSVDLECLFEDIDEAEVIGNIYENPDLLEVGK
ncbi:YopX family protein [Brevibacillus porteri]|nr:YopX family protein [Brevibacillus porteri]MED1801807.1 YopX family protein [Brevibacillus porteri]MED2134938.1 YopX family protein [Brevibacillus porteri]MED2745460.1 YopX family protein [Brevibacillus porteri]MED2815794.1 YopX family protein [Brevibacillus porteri]MED2897632.1 YopX family protein [Brevibacillus porteri]